MYSTPKLVPNIFLCVLILMSFIGEGGGLTINETNPCSDGRGEGVPIAMAHMNPPPPPPFTSNILAPCIAGSIYYS